MEQKPQYARKFIAGSNSRLELYETCPHFFKLQNLDKVPSSKGPALLLGIAAHEFFTDYVKHCVESGQATDLGWAEDNAERYAANVPPELQADMISIADRFTRSYSPSGAEHLGVEMEAAFTREWEQTDWKDWDRVYMRFKMDRVYRESREDGEKVLVVEDFKTDRAIEARQQIGTSKQLRRYAFAASLLWPGATTHGVVVRLQYARYGVVREALVPAEEFPAIKAEIEAKMKRLNAEQEWNPTPGPHCGYCPYVARCPIQGSAWRDTSLQIEGPDDAPKVAEMWMYLKALVKEYEERLRAYVTGNGEIELRDGSKLGFVKVEKLAFTDAKRVVEALLEQGVDKDTAWSIVGVTKTGVEKALKSLGRGKLKEQWPFFAGIAEDATETHFKTYRDKEGEADVQKSRD